jgi:predicted nucleotide-binding protein (sugar kinase/HSP70/actin superfamily)
MNRNTLGLIVVGSGILFVADRDVGPALEAAKSFIEESFSHPNETTAAVLEQRIGIPRALTTHSLFPLYSTFFSVLGMEVVLSGVDPRGDLRSHSGFCLPAQIARIASTMD